MTKEEIKEATEKWLKARDALMCPMAAAFRLAEPANQVPHTFTCLKEKCRFWTPATQEKIVDPQLMVVGNKPPEIEMVWQCEFDVLSSEIADIHLMLQNFFGSMRIVPGPGVRPR